MKIERLNIRDELNWSNGVAVEQGELMLRLIRAALERADRVEVSFAGMEGASTAFLRAMVTQLYAETDADEVDQRVTFVDAIWRHEQFVQHAREFGIEKRVNPRWEEGIRPVSHDA